MKCPECQFENPAGMNFCVACGAKPEFCCACGHDLTSLAIEQRHSATMQDRSPSMIWGVARRVGNPDDTEALVKAFEELKIKLPKDPDGFTSYIDHA